MTIRTKWEHLSSKYKQFKTWMDFNPPGALSWDDWQEFGKQFKAKAPIRYFIRDTLPEFFSPVNRKWTATCDFFRYRCLPRHRYHAMSTGEKPGYADLEHRLLHVNFNALKEFVEIEQAWHDMAWDSDHKYPNWFKRNFGNQSFPEIGIKHFEWASSLDDPLSKNYEPNCAIQAAAGREILTLYAWWTEERPSRPELDYPSFGKEGDDVMGILSDKLDRTSQEYKQYKAACDNIDVIEEDRIQEDNDMLIRLIKIRRSLWT